MTVINEKPFIKSLYDKINSENKTWICTIFMCDENEIEQTNIEDNTSIIVKEDTTLYAIWKPNVTKTYLYNAGQTNSEIQSIEKYVSGSSKAGTFTVNPTYLSVRKSATNSEWNHLYLISKGMFDFTGFSKLYVSFSYMKLVTAQKYTDNNIRQGLVRFGISTSNTNYSDSSFDAFTDAISPPEHSAVSEGARVLEVDISGFDDLAFLKFCCNTSNWTGQQTDFDIDQIWVE